MSPAPLAKALSPCVSSVLPTTGHFASASFSSVPTHNPPTQVGEVSPALPHHRYMAPSQPHLGTQEQFINTSWMNI